MFMKTIEETSKVATIGKNASSTKHTVTSGILMTAKTAQNDCQTALKLSNSNGAKPSSCC